MLDVSARKRSEERLAATIEERDGLRRALMRAQEQERLRLAHELHDQTGQGIAAAMLELKHIEELIERPARDRLRRLRTQLEEIGKSLHRVALELRPAAIDELGLADALGSYLAEWGAQYGVNVDFCCSERKLDNLADDARTTIYRVVQEGLTNIAKHARGVTSVSVVVKDMGASIRLMIEDNGCGFDPSAGVERRGMKGGLGLVGMRERLRLVNGDLEIESAAGAGTTLFVRVPCRSEGRAA